MYRVMRRPGPLHQLRSVLADLLGISDERARDGSWWEIDLIIAFLIGVFVLGAFAWTQI
jgi:hypothetical protein